nr:site-specific integrase [Arthrobacter woluwensis]
MDAALTAPGGLRWVFALALGPRQGERLALGRDDINLAANTITINKSLYRLPWKHGCGDDAPACGRRYGSNCPQRRDGGLFVGPPKSAAGNREIPIPAPMVPLIKEQFHLLDRIKIEEGPNWAPFTPANPPRDKVKPYEPFFARRDGRPMDPRTDHAEWKRFLTAAGVRETRLHDARHTAATILLVLGVDPRVVMDILGWSQVSMLSRYQHVLDEVRQAAGQQIGNMLFGPPTPPAPPTPAPEPAGNVIGVDFTARSRRREAR